jgi:hypothetical protein
MTYARLTDALRRICDCDRSTVDYDTNTALLEALADADELLLTLGPLADAYGCICTEWERHQRIPHRACPVHWIGPLERPA